MSSEFVGQPFFTKEYKEAHPETSFQHRGKGRWYPVGDADAAVAPPQKRLAKIKAAKKTASQATKTEDGTPEEPKEPKVIRKRPAINLDEPVELKETRTRKRPANLDDEVELTGSRTRNGSAREAPIDVDNGPKEPEDPARPTKRRRSSPVDEGSDIAVGPLQAQGSSTVFPPFIPLKTKAKKSPTKKKTAAPKQVRSRKNQQTIDVKKKQDIIKKQNKMKMAAEKIKKYVFKAPLGLSESDSPQDKSDMNDDLKAFGITKAALAKRGPEPLVDNATQRVTGSKTNAARKMETEARIKTFEAKQARRQAKRGKVSAFGKRMTATADGENNTNIIVEDDAFSALRSNWVLFDPRHQFPPMLGDPPKIFERYAHYQPGNMKIVAYNTESFSVQLRRTPDHFLGKAVVYSKRAGPKLVPVGEEEAVSEEEEAEAAPVLRGDTPLSNLGSDAGGEEGVSSMASEATMESM